MQLVETLLSLLHAAPAFEVKWLGHHRNRESAQFGGELCDERGAAGDGSASQTRGNDNNIYASAGFAYLRCHVFFLSSKSSEPGRCPRPLSSILGWLNHGPLYLANNILCHWRASIQHLVKKYYY